MTEPERILEGSGDDFEVALLRSAKPDGPSAQSIRHTMVALGLGSGITAATSAASAATAAAKAGASIPPAAGATAAAAGQSGATALFGSVTVKWIGIASVAGLLAWGAASQRSSNETPATANLDPRGEVGVENPRPGEPTSPPQAAPAEPAVPNAAEKSATDEEPAAEPTKQDAPASPLGQPLPTSAPRQVTKPQTAPTTKSKPSLSDEVAALDKARKAMDDDPDAALAALEDYDSGFEGGVLSQEADVLKIEALARAGKKDQAKAAAGAFLAKHPNSPLAARVRRAIQ